MWFWPTESVKSGNGHVFFSKQCCAFDETVLQRADRKKGNIMVGYSLQSWRYFAHVVNEIRTQLRFQPYIQEKANDIMREIFVKYSCPFCIFRNKSPVFIGVHIRRGDIVNQEKLQEYGYLTAPIGYIYQAMNYYIQHFKKYYILLFVQIPWYGQRMYSKNPAISTLNLCTVRLKLT